MNGVKKTGDPRKFETGAQRDSGTGKPRMSLVPHTALERVMQRYLQGAETYGPNNWTLGMKYSVLYDSAMRHMMQFWQGDDSEDHLAAACWNIMGMMHFEKNMPEMDDREDFC